MLLLRAAAEHMNIDKKSCKNSVFVSESLHFTDEDNKSQISRDREFQNLGFKIERKPDELDLSHMD